MNLPPDHVIAGYFATIRKACGQHDPGSKLVPAIDQTEARTLRLVKRARTPGPEVDGYSTGGLGAGARSTEQMTTVEAAVIALVDQERPQQRDTTVELAWDAVGYAQQMAHSWGALASVLDRADRLATPTGKAELAGAGPCMACDTDIPGTAENRLRAGYCPACRKAWERAGCPDRSVFRSMRQAKLRDTGTG